jgi:hypothetical protein
VDGVEDWAGAGVATLVVENPPSDLAKLAVACTLSST